MRFNDAGLQLLKSFENCELTAYRDVKGVLTIGWGDTRDVSEGLTITQLEADTRLQNRLSEVIAQVTGVVPQCLSENQFSAVVCFTYNEGFGHLMQSTLLNCLKKGQWPSAAEEFLKWNKAGGVVYAGLTRRREAERALFLLP